ncbi:MAG TPA: EAL domain-containing protein [Motilibacteraceae bacterium]|nr:EAL domain-containing protein [Motilibacteraceae bacterium]
MTSTGSLRASVADPAAGTWTRAAQPVDDPLSQRQRLRRALRAVAQASAADVLHEACRQALGLVPADQAIVSAPTGDGLTVLATAGGGPVPVGHRIPRAGTLGGLALDTGEALLCRDSRRDPRTVAPLSASVGALSSVMTPLERDGRQVAVLALLSGAPSSFDEADLELLALFGDVISTQLTTSLLVEEREGMSAAMEEQARLLTTVFEAIDEGIAVSDRDGRIMMVNAAAERILGRGRDEVVAHLATAPVWRTVHPDGSDWPGDTHPTSLVLRTGRAVVGRTMGIHHPDGQLRWLAVSATPVGEDGLVDSVVTTFLDITDARASVQALAGSEARLRAASELTGLAWWEYDVASDSHVWSETMFRLAGVDPAEGAPNRERWLSCVHPDDRPGIHELVPGETVTSAMDLFRVCHPDGSVRTLQTWHEVELDADGGVVRMFGTALDVTQREAAALQLAESERRLAEAQEMAGLAWWEWETATGVLRWSAGMHRLAGFEPGRTPDGDTWLSLVHPEDRGSSGELERRALEHGEPYEHVFRIVRQDGEVRHLRSSTRPMYDAGGRIIGLRGATLDVTVQETAAQELTAREEQFRIAFDDAPTGLVMFDVLPDGSRRVLRANAALARMLGWSVGELLTMDPILWVDPERRDRDAQGIAQLAAGELGPVTLEQRYRHRDGHAVPAWVVVTPVRGPDRTVRYLMAHVVDLTQQHAQRAELQRLALTDTLTGLANRALVQDRTEQALKGLRRHGGHVAMLLLDLDGFKRCNDSLGHQQGDHLLVEVAARLRAVTRAGTTVGRLGGDEFVVVLEHLDDPEDALGVAHRILDALRQPHRLAGTAITATGSVGIAVTDDPAMTQADLLRDADLALYAAKDAGRDRAVVFDDALRVDADRRLTAEVQVRRALGDDALRMVCQPVVDLASGRVLSAEALVRVQDPHRGLVLPEHFVHVAETTGLIPDVDFWMLEQAARALAEGHQVPDASGRLHPLDRVAVNVSGATLADPRFAERFDAVLTAWRVPARRLVVEITESTLLAPTPAVGQALEHVRSIGAQLGLDDFGTGWSALSYLQRYELDFLKVDRSFVARLGSSAKDRALVASIVDLAHAVGLVVTAEGVETHDQAEALREMGCEHAQGWYFGRPAPLVG